MDKGNPVNLVAKLIHDNSTLSKGKALDLAEELLVGLHDDGWLLIHSWGRTTVNGDNFYTGKVWEG